MSRWAEATLLIAVVLTGCTSGSDPVVFPTASPASTLPASTPKTTQTIATGLPVPWGLAFLPDGAALVTLRDQGEVLRVAEGATPVSVSARWPAQCPRGSRTACGSGWRPSARARRRTT